VLISVPEGEPALPVESTGALVFTNGDPEAAAVVPAVGVTPPTGAGVATEVAAEGEPGATCDPWAELPWGDAGTTPWHVPAKADVDDVIIPAAASPRMDMPIAATTAAMTRFIVVVISKSPYWLVVR
jgi:hypothetical protein